MEKHRVKWVRDKWGGCAEHAPNTKGGATEDAVPNATHWYRVLWSHPASIRVPGSLSKIENEAVPEHLLHELSLKTHFATGV